MLLIDYLCYRSQLRHYHPRLKLTFALTTLLLCVCTRNILLCILTAAACLYLTVTIGKISAGQYLRLFMVPGVFLITGCIAILFEITRQLPADISPLLLISLGKVTIFVTIENLLLTLQTLAVVGGSISCLYFLSLSTPVCDILMAIRGDRQECSFLRKTMIELTLLTYRFIFLLLDIAGQMDTARKSRLGNRNFQQSCRTMGTLFSGLLLRAYQKSARLYDAMESRCYDGDIQFLPDEYQYEKKYYIYIFLFELLLTGIYLLATLYPLFR